MTIILNVFGWGLLLAGVINGLLYLAGVDTDPQLRVVVMTVQVSSGAAMITLADIARRIRRRANE